MSKKRIYQFAREQDMSSKELLEIAQDAGLDYSSHMATINDNEMAKLKEFMNNKTNKQQKSNTANQSGHNQTKQATADKKNNQKDESSNEQSSLNPEKRTTSEKQKAKERQNRSKKRHSRQHRGINGGPAGNRTKRKTNTDHKQQDNSSQQSTKKQPLPDVVEYTEGMTVAELAKELHKPAAEIVKKLFMMGVIANKNQSLDSDSIEIILEEYGVQAQEKVEIDETDFDTYFEQEVNEENLTLRPPTVTIMGHVDHGKTTLLDTLRQEKVADGEAGGITQHIGAYQLEVEGKPITFLDTPGHAAFTTMRARGADVTDIAIIVVAADDGVMPQTVEAINHAKAAEVPIIVAVNKVDKPEANPQQVMQELSQYELIPEDWGGQTIFVEISAKFNQNLDELLEMILLVAEVEELKADPTRLAIGTVLEARLDKAQGPIATLLVQEGTLKHGDPIVVGTANGRIRTMTNDQGQRVKKAGPSMPVEITGLNDTPQAGDRFVVFDDEKKARSIGQSRAQAANEAQRNAVQKVTLENLFDSIEEGELKEITVIVKGDVQGSVEAIVASLEKIEVEGVKIKIVHTGVGAINESDVTLASASGSIIIGFNVRPTPQAQESANREQIDIRTHRVIYNAIDEIESAMKGMLDPEFEEKVTGQATVRETFNVSKVGTIAGCYVNDGVIKRSSSVRVIRQGVVKYEGELSSLKRFQDDAKEVSNGYECGLTIENFNDIKIDDVIEAYEMVEVKRN